jgi:hypothetical protein
MKRSACLLVLFFTTLAVKSHSQGVVTTGDVRGVAWDSSGASVDAPTKRSGRFPTT